MRGRIESGNINVNRSLKRREIKLMRKKDLLYRQFTKGNKILCNLLSLRVFVRKF